MSLTFNPALGTAMTLHVPEVGDAHLRFTASFPSRAACEQARAEGVRVEMWTNLPVGEHSGDWHAVPFVFAPDAKADASTAAPSLSLGPAFSEARGAEDGGEDVFLDVVLPNHLCGARFSFTYRLVRAWGAVEWLGAYGQNGDLVLERLEERFAVADGCAQKDGVLVREGGDADSAVVAELSKDMDWACWAFDREGWATYDASAYAPASAAVLLVPRSVSGSRSLAIPQPLLFKVDSASDASVSVSSTGEVVVHNASSLLVRDMNASSLDETASTLPGMTTTALKDGFVALTIQRAEDESAPTVVSIVPTACTSVPTTTRLTFDDLHSVYSHLGKTETVLVDLSRPAFTTVPAGPPTDISIEVGPTGGAFVLASLHELAQAGEELPWSFALLSSSSSAQIVSPASDEEMARILPTPPPSPPVASVPLSVATSVPASTSQRSAAGGMSIALPSFGEVVSKQMEASPLTPVSPPARAEAELSEKLEDEFVASPAAEEAEDEKQVVPAPSSRSQQPIRGGLLRFLFVWLFRALLTRISGFFGRMARSWGLPGFSSEPEENEHGNGEVTVEPAPEAAEASKDAEVEESVSEDVQEDGPEANEDTSLSAAVPHTLAHTPSHSESTLADDELPEKEDYLPCKLEQATSMETVVYAAPRPRFLADIHSNAVSLLVRAPHARLPLSALHITLAGKPVADTDAGYSCARLAENVFLVGLQGPEDGARLEIALD